MRIECHLRIFTSVYRCSCHCFPSEYQFHIHFSRFLPRYHETPTGWNICKSLGVIFVQLKRRCAAGGNRKWLPTDLSPSRSVPASGSRRVREKKKWKTYGESTATKPSSKVVWNVRCFEEYMTKAEIAHSNLLFVLSKGVGCCCCCCCDCGSYRYTNQKYTTQKRIYEAD